MNIAKLTLATRQRLDDTIAPYLWSDAEIVQYLNEAVKEACLRARLYQLTRALNVSANNPVVNIGDNNVRLLSVEWGVDRRPLDNIRMPDLDGTWRTVTRERPTSYIDEGTTLHLYPIPSLAGTVTITQYAVPAEPLGAGDDPPFSLLWHLPLVNWACHLAYLKNDADTFNEQKAITHSELFTRDFGEPMPARAAHYFREENRPRARPHFV